MSKILSLYTCHEVQVDDQGDFIKEYETNLPHADIIANEFISDWNKQADFMRDLMNKQVAKDRIASCKARRYKAKSPECTIAIEIVTKPGCTFHAIRDNIYDFISAQFADGWGEGFFGPVNVLSDPNDKTRFYVD